VVSEPTNPDPVKKRTGEEVNEDGVILRAAVLTCFSPFLLKAKGPRWRGPFLLLFSVLPLSMAGSENKSPKF
jgi:hypothetical protein